MRWYDAHNHLQDARFNARQESLLAACREAGVVAMVVNGSGEEDWPEVASLARRHPDRVIPSFGCHPWYLAERTPEWRHQLDAWLGQFPNAAVGEIGLDRWKPGLGYAGQEEAFLAQLHVAADRDRAVSIHCLRAWGRLLELLQSGPRPGRGFLLHSYGGPREMIEPFARLGARFSFPGYFAHARKERQRDAFRAVPEDRLLVETDAPDQLLPPELQTHSLPDPANGRPINHPANLPAVYHALARTCGVAVEALADQVERNFLQLFGAPANPRDTDLTSGSAGRPADPGTVRA